LFGYKQVVHNYMKDIISVGYYLPTNEDDFIRLESNGSLSDSDLVIFCPNFDNSKFSYGYNATYRGKPRYDLNDSSKIQESSKHWNRELEAYLKSGRNLYVFLTEKYEFYIDSGRRRSSGTGRNQKVTNLVEPFSNYKFLPFDIKINNAKGKKMVIQNDLIKTYFKCFENDLNFEAYIEPKENYIELIKTKNLDKLLSIQFKEYDGHIVFLPYLETEREDFYEEDHSWNSKAIKYGKKLIHSILEIDKSLSSTTEKTPRPDWIDEDEFKLRKAEKVKLEIEKNKKSITKLEKECINLNEVLKVEEGLKDLLFETGKPLELAVIKALETLGFNASNYDDGILELDQVIISPEKIRYIGECEGKDNKAIDISKFRQLQDSLNEDFEREDVEEKAFGILFGNPQRLLPINERTNFFTQKCINGAQREKIALIKTTDLFKVSKYLSEKEDEEYQKKCRDAIYNGLGTIIEFPNT